VAAAYWFVSARGRFTLVPVRLDAAVDARFDEVVRTIVDGIRDGVFPCRVDPPSAMTWRTRTYLDPDAGGTRDRYREWTGKRSAPELAAYRALAEPDSDGPT